MSELLKAQDPTCVLSAFARKPEQVDKLEEAEVRGILFKDLDDFETIKNTAKQYDSESLLFILFNIVNVVQSSLLLRLLDTRDAPEPV